MNQMAGILDQMNRNFVEQPNRFAKHAAEPLVLKGGFRAEQAANGGWIVSDLGVPGDMPRFLGAFTTFEDMLAWLPEQVRAA